MIYIMFMSNDFHKNLTRKEALHYICSCNIINTSITQSHNNKNKKREGAEACSHFTLNVLKRIVDFVGVFVFRLLNLFLVPKGFHLCKISN